jgi:hypothetical protein
MEQKHTSPDVPISKKRKNTAAGTDQTEQKQMIEELATCSREVTRAVDRLKSESASPISHEGRTS